MDKRRYARLVARLDFTAKKITPDNAYEPVTVVSKDISIGGVGFCSEHEFKVGDIVKLTIRMPSDKVIITVCGVKWVQEKENLYNASSREYHVGLEFTQISDIDRKEIGDFISSANYNEP
jgi:c-di-GMP-binding flagellar brake protein YcgR